MRTFLSAIAFLLVLAAPGLQAQGLCPDCRREFKEGRFCPTDGARLGEARRCPKCGYDFSRVPDGRTAEVGKDCWAGFPIGSWRRERTTGTKHDRAGHLSPVDFESKLVSIGTTERGTLIEHTSTKAGELIEANECELRVACKCFTTVQEGWTSGEEVITIDGRPLSCFWMERQGPEDGVKHWFCRDVPGHLVKTWHKVGVGGPQERIESAVDLLDFSHDRSRIEGSGGAAEAPPDEAAAVLALVRISAAECVFFRGAGPGHEGRTGYAAGLEVLARENLIDAQLATGTRHGYRFAIESAGADSFSATAVPIGPADGRRFKIDASGVVLVLRGSPASPSWEPLDP